MHEYVFYNSQSVSTAEALIHAVSPTALYGKGIFSTIAIYDTVPFVWEKHWRRLHTNAAKLGVDISEFSESATINALNQMVAMNGVVNGRARITFFDELATGTWSIDTRRKTNLLITTADNRKIANNFRLTVSPYRVNTTSPLAGLKSCNYLDHLMAFEEAKTRGFDEAVRLNERGEVCSASMGNVFWQKDSLLCTPSLKTGCLAGTTREYIVENLKCNEVAATFDDLRFADDIFLTSAGIGVVQAAEFAGRATRQQPHEILELLPKPI